MDETNYVNTTITQHIQASKPAAVLREFDGNNAVIELVKSPPSHFFPTNKSPHPS
jgi:hypothetical protein